MVPKKFSPDGFIYHTEVERIFREKMAEVVRKIDDDAYKEIVRQLKIDPTLLNDD